MSNDSFAYLFETTTKTKHNNLAPGQKITAKIIEISGEHIFLDVGGKSEGIMDKSEIIDSEESTVSLGDSVDVYFVKATGGSMLFTTKLGSGGDSSQLEDAWRNAIPVEGFVKREIKGGFEVMIGGAIRTFCPFSQMGLRRVENPGETYTDTKMTFLITRFEENGRNIVVSARALQEAEREEQRDKLRETLSKGQTISGTISSIQDFGLFVDIGGVDGLIPISEIGWSRVEDLNDSFVVGQELTAVIIKLEWDKNRIALSLKECLDNPWDSVEENFSEGSVHTCKVSRLTTFGAFVTICPGINGLLHISKLGNGRRINHPKEVLEEGQDVEIRIEEINTDDKKISLVPADFVSTEDSEQADRKEYKKFISKSKKKSSGMGSLGELLQAKLAAKE